MSKAKAIGANLKTGRPLNPDTLPEVPPIASRDLLNKMLCGVGALAPYDYPGQIPSHFNSLGLTKSVTWEAGLILKNFVERERPTTLVEMGTFRGYSTAWLILGTLVNAYGDVYTYDLVSEGFFGQMWYDFYSLPKTHFHFHQISGGIWDYAGLLPDQIDFLFHDASHELDATQKEMGTLLPRVPVGGTVIVDDMLYKGYEDMQKYLSWLFTAHNNWEWSVLPIGTGLGIARRRS